MPVCVVTVVCVCVYCVRVCRLVRVGIYIYTNTIILRN